MTRMLSMMLHANMLVQVWSYDFYDMTIFTE